MTALLRTKRRRLGEVASLHSPTTSAGEVLLAWCHPVLRRQVAAIVSGLFADATAGTLSDREVLRLGEVCQRVAVRLSPPRVRCSVPDEVVAALVMRAGPMPEPAGVVLVRNDGLIPGAEHYLDGALLEVLATGALPAGVDRVDGVSAVWDRSTGERGSKTLAYDAAMLLLRGEVCPPRVSSWALGSGHRGLLEAVRDGAGVVQEHRVHAALLLLDG